MNKPYDSDRNFPAWLTLSWAWEQAMDDPEAVKAAIGRNLRRLREARGLTQKSLAELSQASLANLKEIESARALPDIGLMAELARILDVPCTALADPACEAKVLSREATPPARPRVDPMSRSRLASGNPNSATSSASR
jgi:transcriptional regulator with XRE-family HTH domain